MWRLKTPHCIVLELTDGERVMEVQRSSVAEKKGPRRKCEPPQGPGDGNSEKHVMEEAARGRGGKK